MMQRVDIALAAYNGMPYISEQIDSILAQTHRDFRLLIRDDGSTDGTQDVIAAYADKYPEKIMLLPSERRLGVKGNFSCLMNYSQAPYLMFSDQDDVWLKDKVAVMLNRMQSLENRYGQECPLLLHTDLTVVDAAKKVISKSFWKYAGINPRRNRTMQRLLFRNVVTGCASMMNRSLINHAVPIPETVYMHDWWIALVAASLGKIVEMPISMVFYRQHGNNVIGARKIMVRQRMGNLVGKLRKPQKFLLDHCELLLLCFGEKLNSKQKKVLIAFLSLPKKSIPMRAWINLKFGL